MKKIINILLEVVGFILIFVAISPSFMTDNTAQAILGAMLVIYSLHRKTMAKLDTVNLK